MRGPLQRLFSLLIQESAATDNDYMSADWRHHRAELCVMQSTELKCDLLGHDLRRLYFMTTHAGSSVRRNHAPWAFNDTVYMTSPACGIGLNKAASGKQVTGSPKNSAWLADLVKSGWRMGNWCTFSRTAAELVGGDKYWHRSPRCRLSSRS